MPIDSDNDNDWDMASFSKIQLSGQESGFSDANERERNFARART